MTVTQERVLKSVINVKISVVIALFVPRDILFKTIQKQTLINERCKLYKNFLVLKSCPVTYSFFKKRDGSTHINLTGLSSTHEVSYYSDRIISRLKSMFPSASLGEQKTFVDAITAKFDVKKPVHLTKLAEKISANSRENWSIKNTSYNSESFPGLFVNTSFGTLIFFASGKILLLGANSIEHCEKSANIIEEITGRSIEE